MYDQFTEQHSIQNQYSTEDLRLKKLKRKETDQRLQNIYRVKRFNRKVSQSWSDLKLLEALEMRATISDLKGARLQAQNESVNEFSTVSGLTDEFVNEARNVEQRSPQKRTVFTSYGRRKASLVRPQSGWQALNNRRNTGPAELQAGQTGTRAKRQNVKSQSQLTKLNSSMAQLIKKTETRRLKLEAEAKPKTSTSANPWGKLFSQGPGPAAKFASNIFTQGFSLILGKKAIRQLSDNDAKFLSQTFKRHLKRLKTKSKLITSQVCIHEADIQKYTSSAQDFKRKKLQQSIDSKYRIISELKSTIDMLEQGLKDISDNQDAAKEQMRKQAEPDTNPDQDVFNYSYGFSEIDERMKTELIKLYKSGKTYKYKKGWPILPSEQLRMRRQGTLLGQSLGQQRKVGTHPVPELFKFLVKNLL